MRDVFPRAPDRTVIEDFLAGQRSRGLDSMDATVANTDQRLRIAEGVDNAWIGPDGSLMVQIGLHTAGGTTVRLINYLAELLSLPDRLEREPSEIGQPTRFTWQGSYIDYGQPFVLAGRLGLAAYRASLIGQVRTQTSAPAHENPARRVRPC